MLFWIRILTYLTISIVLSQLNVWADGTVNALFIFVGRVMLVLSPVLYRTFKPYALSVTQCIMLLSIIGLLVKFNIVCIIVMAVALSVSGYLQKLLGSHSFTGAGNLKIAANIGGLAGGGILFLLPHLPRFLLLLLIGSAILVTLLFGIRYEKKIVAPDYIALNQNYRMTKVRFAWCLFGVAIGIKFYAIFTLLPQLILKTRGELPNWYGFIILVNALGIIIGQRLTIKAVQNWAIKQFYISLLIGLLIIGAAPFLHLDCWLSATIWTLVLTSVECIISAMDNLSALQGALLYKEAAIGIGGAFSALFARYGGINPFLLSALFGMFTVILGYCFMNKQSNNAK